MKYMNEGESCVERILLLNDREFPGRFNSICVTPPASISKIQYTEKKILDSLNDYNKKLNVCKIEYLKIEDQFPNYKSGNSNGVLVEEFEIDSILKAKYQANECFVYSQNGKNICRRIMMYIFISYESEDTRTAFVSQTVFPTLLDYAKDYLSSPCYSIANHKFCFINILNKTITSNMILRHLASLCAAGMDYVEVFNNNSINPKKIPRDLKGFLKEYASNYENNYDAIADVYEDNNYRVEFKNKIFIWSTSEMISNKIESKNSIYRFKGSNEKFYWIETLPMAIFSYDIGYKIDYSNYSDFIATFKNKFSENSKKFARCEILLRYIEKYFV